MADTRRTMSILLVSASGKVADQLAGLLPPGKFAPVMTAGSAGEAKRLMAAQPCDIVVINAPLPDEYGVELAGRLASEGTAGVMMIVPVSQYDQISESAGEYGVLTLPRPLSRQSAIQALNMLAAATVRIARMESRAQSLREKMEEIRLISRAKLLLMEKQGMNEAEAHRFIEKSAMDRCKKRSEVAKIIIDTYES